MYSVALVLGLSIGLYAFVLARHSIFASTGSTKAHVLVLIEQSKNNLKTLLISRIVGAITLLMALFLIGLIVFVALNKALEFKHFLVGGIALGCCLLFAGVFIWLKKQIIQLERQIEFLTKIEQS